MTKITLEISFEDKPFIPPTKELVFVYQYVMDKTTTPETTRNCILPMWLSAIQAGNPKATIAALSPLAHSNIWKWEEYDIWEERLKKDAIVPEQWAIAERAAKKWPSPKHAKRMLLLDRTLHSAVRSRMEYLPWQKPPRASKSWTMKNRSGDVDLKLARQFAYKVRRSDWSTWPPFFPGDTSNIEIDLGRYDSG